MRTKLLFFVCVLLCQSVWAGSISQEEAQQRALQFLRQKSPTPQRRARIAMPGKGIQLELALANQSYYVFNVGQQEGFVMLSNDDAAPAILGYADEGAFDAVALPANMREWLQGYADQLDYLRQHGNAGVRESALSSHAAIAPLLACEWNQDSPYNDLCPTDDGTRSVTGCVATAMAQVMYYHRHPSATTAAIPSYTTKTKGLSVSGIDITTIDWNDMLDSYSGNETATQKTAVAQLMLLCGTAVQMNYTSSISGANDAYVPIALKTYFDYDASTRLEARGNYRANQWDELIYNELSQSRPVYYGGQSTGGGHAFVVDGYDKDGFFHVNWGWGGSYNGYFLLSILDPGNNSGIGASSTDDGYSYDQSAVIGARPNTGQPCEETVRMSMEGIRPASTTVNKSNGYFTVNAYIENCFNITDNTYNMELGLGVYDRSGNLIHADSNGYAELGSGWGWSSIGLQANIPSLSDGVYQITAVSRRYGSDTWNKNLGGNLYFLTATVSGDVMTLQAPTIDLAGSMEVSGNMEVGSSQTVTATIRNNGTLFCDQVFLRVNGKNNGGRYFEVEAGESETIEMSFTPGEAGTCDIALGYLTYTYDETEGWQEQFHEMLSTTATIDAAKSHTLTFSNGMVTNATGETITEKTAKIQMTVTNEGQYDYDNDIRTYLFRLGDDNWWWSQGFVNTPVTIGAGQSEVVSIETPKLKNGVYWFITVYKSEGEFISYNDSKSYRALYSYTVQASEDPEPGLTGDGTIENPFTVADAIVVTNQLEVGGKSAERYYIKGTVSSIKYTFSPSYGTATFNISDDGATTAGNQFTAYGIYYLENKPWVDGNTQIKQGDEVILYGIVTKYNATTLETANKDAYIYSLNGKTKEEVTVPLNTAGDIAAFKSLNVNDEATLTLTDAQVLYVNDYNGTKELFVRDASGAIDFYDTGIEATAGQILNGTINVRLGANGGFQAAKLGSNKPNSTVVVTDGYDPVPVELLFSNAASHNCDLVVAREVSIDEKGRAVDADNATISLYDRFKLQLLTGLKKDGTKYDITGLIYDGGTDYGTEIVVTQVSESPVGTGVGTIAAGRQTSRVYNLNGQRVAKTAKGLYIVDGKKVVVR